MPFATLGFTVALAEELVWLAFPFEAVIVMGKVPTDVAAVVLSVMVVVFVPPVMSFGLKLKLAPGTPEAEK